MKFENELTLKGSNVYSTNNASLHATPSGSHHVAFDIFYKPQIPWGLFLESMEANIQKGLAELKKLMK